MNIKYLITQVNNHTVCARYDNTNNNCHYLKVLDSGSIIGNVYIGRVENIVKNINSAFIEIADKQKCYYSIDDNKHPIYLNSKNNDSLNIGDKILVKVTNDPIKTKPATVSSKIEFSGNYIVISNDIKGVSLSKKINSNDKCVETGNELAFRLNTKLSAISQETGYKDIFRFGIIMRSNCVNAAKETIYEEFDALSDEYIDMLRCAIYGTFYTKLHSDRPSYIDDIIHLYGDGDNESEVITDIPEVYDNIIKYIPNINKERLRLYKDALLPLYKLYSVEKEINTALNKKVWLDCGGYLIVEQTEALTVIDVNSGKNIAKSKKQSDKDKSALKTNLEAANELMRQLILRNISGIVIVDFINMENNEYNDELMSSLKKLAKMDYITTTIVDITKLGLVEITRKKAGKSLREIFSYE
ncbi:MAG: ribonuclease E/G [Eubacteriales bacterium]|nr:ribonuclease E/G [Eubacteriales bacterium]